MSEPKTIERRIAFRKANRKMQKRRHDVAWDAVTYQNTELLSRFTSETGKILPRRVTGVSAKLHRRVTRAIKQARSVNMLP